MSLRPRILLTGANGQVGWELRRTLGSLGDLHAFDSRGLDLADDAALRNAVEALAPDIIVNAAAYTAVDKAEGERDRAQAVNAVAPRVFAEAAAARNAVLVHFSTDYVFDGSGTAPWKETDDCAPLNVYGATKHAGEQAIQAVGGRHLIFRTSWVYGARGNNFLLTMQRLMRERPELKIVADQVGAPTWCRDLAEVTAQVLSQLRGCPDAETPWGIYHLTNAGETSWHGFARAIQAGSHDPAIAETRLLPIATADYPTPATRPLNSRLDTGRFESRFGLKLPEWQVALALCMAGEKNEA